jgi:hypothetical protein
MRIDDDEDQNTDVLWPSFGNVGAKEPDARERPKFDTEGVPRPSAMGEDTLQTTHKDGPSSFFQLSYLQNIVQTKLAKFISLLHTNVVCTLEKAGSTRLSYGDCKTRRAPHEITAMQSTASSRSRLGVLRTVLGFFPANFIPSRLLTVQLFSPLDFGFCGRPECGNISHVCMCKAGIKSVAQRIF